MFRTAVAGVGVATLAVAVSTCRLDELIKTPISGTLAVAPGAISDSAAVGSLALRVVDLDLSTVGTARLSYHVDRAQQSTWLALNVTTGMAPDTLHVTFDPAGLASGSYQDTIVITSNNSATAAMRVPVLFTVYDCRATALTLDATSAGAITNADCGAPHRAGRYARLFSFSGFAGDSVSIELTGTGLDGYLILDSTATTAAPPLVEADDCRGLPGDPCLLYQRLPATGTYLLEVTTFPAAQTGGYALSVHRPRAPAAPDTLRQLRADSATVIGTGGVIAQTTVVFRASVSDPDLGDSVRLEIELRPVSVAFINTATATGAIVGGGGGRAYALIPPGGLSDDSSYHWQARVVDQTGRASAWTAFGGNAESSADFRILVPQPPAVPVALAQLKADGITPIPIGGSNQTRSVVLQATVTDPDAGDQVRFEVEVRPVGTAFTDVPGGSSAPLASGSSATVTIPGLVNNVAYHWQARAVDQTGAASVWTSFGGNPETAADFDVKIQATQLVFTVQPTTTAAGAPITPAVQVTAQDALGAAVAGFSDTVKIALAANPTGDTLSGTLAAVAVNGVATFADLRLKKAGAGYQLRASSPGLNTPSPSSAFSIVPGAASQFVFTQQPVSTAAGDTINPAIQVTAKDSSGNVVTSYAGGVTIAIGPGAPTDTLFGTKTRTAALGVAIFTDLRIDRAGPGYTLVASDGAITKTSQSFDILPQGAARLAFTVDPVDAVAGAAIAPPVKVTAFDTLGNTVTGFTGDITLAVAANPGSGALRGTTTRAAVAGVATFADLSVDKTGAGYTLTATAAGAASTTSAAFDIAAAPASRLAFTVQPTSVTAGGPIQPGVQVSARDSLGNAVPTYNDSITVTIATNPGGGTLSGTRTVAAAGGIATFPDLSIDRADTGYTLAGAAAGLSGATSAKFDVLPGAAARLAFTVQPTPTPAGSPITPAVQVTARDALGNTATGFAGSVTVALAANPGGGVLFGTTTASAAAGVATFANLAIDRADPAYTLTASGSGLAGDTSVTFAIAAGSAGSLAIVTPPSAAAQSGMAFAQQPAVQLQDQSGNPVAQAGVQITAAVATGAGSAALAGNTATTDAAGLATFSGLAISGPVGNYTLVFGGTGLTPATSGTITVAAGAAAKLGLTTQPSASAQNGVPFPQQPVLQVQDAAGNPVALAGIDVAAAISSGSGGGALSGTTPVSTDGLGQAAFVDLTITGTVGNRTLDFTATAAGLAGVTSTVVTLEAGAATQIALSAGDGQTATAGTAVAIPPAVLVRDQSGNPVGGVAVTFATVSGGGAVNPTAAVMTGGNGIAAVTAWTLGPTAGPNGLRADAAGLSGSPVIFSATATVGAAATIAKSSGDNLTGIVFTTLGTPHEVLVTDANNNPVPGVTVNWSVPVGQGSVNPTSSITDTSGHAQTTRTLGATLGTQTTTASAILTGGPASVIFTITATAAGASNMVKFAGDGQTDTVGATLATPIAVRVTDQFTNPVQGVQITWSVLDGGGSVAPVTSFTDANGVAATAWTLGTQMTATDSTQLIQATGVATPANFVATTRPGAVHADSSRVTVSAATIPASNGGSTSTITVTARDGFGNRVPGQTVVLAATGSGNALTQPGGPTDPNGIATGTLSSTVAEGKTVSATAGGVALTQTPVVTVQPGSGASLRFLVPPAPATAGAAVAPPVQVEVLDAFGNRATASTAGITVALGNNPTGATLSGTAFQMAVAGVATFADLSVDKAGTGYTLTAAAPPRAPDTSTAFDVSPGSPASINVNTGNNQTTVVASAVATPPSVRVTDANGNGVPGVTVTFTPSGDGSVTGGTAITDSQGVATVGSWTLATVAGANSLTAAVGGLAPALLSATGTPGPISAAQSGVSAIPGTIAAGASSATITVTVRDQFGNGIAGATVVLAATGTADSLAQPAGPTDASGTATGTLSSTLAEVKTVTATANGVALIASATVTVTAGSVSATHSTIAAAPTSLTASSGSSASTITVTAKDAFDNPVSGAGVVLAATGANNALIQPAVSTDLAGAVTGSLSATTSGVKTVSATINGVSITPTASVTVNAGAATQLAFRTQPTSATAGVAIAPAIEVAARDPFNNRDSTFTGSVTVSMLANAGGGTLSGTVTVPAVKGLATFGDLSIDKAGTAYTLSGTVGGLTAATSTAFDITAGAAATIGLNGGNGQSAAAGSAVAIAPSAVVLDQFANPVAGVPVTFAVATGGGSVIPTTPISTSASGVAQVTSWTLGTAAGPNTLTATAAGLTGSPVTFTATGSAGGATTIALAGGDAQTDTAGATLAGPYTVLVTDANTNPVVGVTVTWAVTGGGGSINPSSITNGSGIATATRVLGTTAGVQTATASVVGLTGSPVAFTATAAHATATQLVVNGGNAQTATVNTAVATPPSVLVRDQFNNPVGGVAVTFAVGLGGGTVSPTSPVTTTGAGIAQVTSWTLGTAAGTDNNTLTATSAGVAGSPVATFTASATAGAATQIAVNGGDNQSAQVGTTVPVAPSVIARDQFGNAVAGVSVTFAVATGGGSVSPTTALTTNAGGIAQVTSWTLGPSAGANSLTATAGGLTGSPVTFTATGFAGSATQLALSAGDAQTDTVGATLAVAYAVVVRDASNNPVQGVPVGWAVTSGGGTILPATATTNASGIATATRTLGTAAGTQTATAAVGGLTGSPVTFTATATHGIATQVAANAGDGQSATVNTTVATAPSVIVRDQFGNPVPGAGVTFAVGSGGGSVSGGSQTTNGAGIATVGSWTLGTAAGPNTVTATAAGLTGSPVTFSATGTAGSATTIALAGGDAQTDTAGATLAVPYTVLVTDALGNPIGGFTVNWAVTGGGGSITTSSVTNGSGIAAATRTFGTTAGAQTAQATASLTGSPVSFTATATHGAATQIAVSAGNNQTATVNTTVAIAPAVLVRDQFNNPVAGVGVTFAVGLGGGSVTSATPTTTASGVATIGSWTLGTAAGANTLTATAAGLAGSPVTFTASATAGAATQIAVNAGDNQSAQVSTAVPVAPSVIVHDQFGNPVAGVSVTFAVGTGGGVVNPTTPLATNAAGIAQVATWTLGTGAGTNTLIATAAVSLTGNPVTFTATGFAGSATQMALSAGDAQTDTVGATLAVAYAVVVRDASNNPVQGIPVGWAVTAGGGTILPATSNTNASGIATATRTLGTAVGAQTATAAVGGLTGSPVAFSATATHGAATQIAVNGGTGQSATVNSAVATAPSVVVRDQFGNPVSGIGVTFAVGLGGGSLTGSTPTTDASGIATVGTWTLGTAAGGNTLTATSGGLTGSPVTFSATGTPGPASAAQSSVVAAPGTITASNGSSASTITVTARDAFGNPIPGAAVVLAAAPTTGNTLTQPAATNGSGVTTGTLSSTVAETKTVSATVNGMLVTQTATVTVATDGVVSAAQSTVSATPGTLTAGGGAATITVTARDALNNPISGATVVLATSGTGNTLTQPAAVTDAGGAATGTLSSTVAETKTISATINGTAVTQTAAVTVSAGAVAASQSTVAAAPATITASSGSSLSTITVTALDAFGNPVSGATVVLAVTGSGNALTQPSATTDASGVATGTVSSTVAEAKTVSATIGGTAITQTAPVTVTVGAVSASQSTVAAAPASITAGSGTATITVTAKDAFGNAIANAGVVLAATPSGGNTLTQPATLTDGAGVATGSLSSTVAELKTISATINGTLVTQTAAVTVTTDGVVSASQSSVTAAPGSITASSGSSATTITVTARDQFGNVIPGLAVSLAATGSANVFTPGASGTGNGSGVFTAAFSSTTAEAKTISATVDGTPVTQTAAVTVTAGAVSAAQTTVSATPTSIAVSSGTATITVTVKDAFGNPIGGASVALAATGTGNTLTQPGSPSDAAGVATGTLSSTVMGTKTISATASGLPVTQTAAVAVTPGPASQLLFTVQPTGITAGGTITPAVQVTAQDAFGNTDTAYTGTVGMAIAANPGGSTLSGTVSVAATGGVAVFSTLSLNKSGAGYTLAATASGVNGDTSTAFTVSAGTATQLIFDVQPSTTAVNAVIAPAMRVRKADAFGNTAVNPRRDIVLSILPNLGAATLGGTTTIRTGAAGTADSGVSVFTDITINTVGVGYTLNAHATAGTAADQLSAPFDIVAGAPASIALFAGNNQTDTVGATLGTAYQVRVLDAGANPVSNVTVTWAASAGSITPTSLTNGSGIASATLVLGTTAGTQTATAAVSGLTGSPVNFSATATAGAATQIAINAGDGQSAIAGTAVAIAPSAIVRDQFGNPKSGVSVTFTTTGGGGTLVPASPAPILTGSNGIAALTSWTLGNTAGANTLSATSGTLTGSPLTFTATGTTGAASTIALSAGNTQTDTVGATLATPYSVLVTDTHGNGVAGVTVTWSAAGGGTITGTTTASTSLTDGTGQASATRILGTIAGTQTATAAVSGLSGSPVNFTATATAGAATQIAIAAGDAQTDTVGRVLPVAPAVLVRDQFNNPVSGVNVTFTVTPGSGSLAPASPATIASGGTGLAALTSWTLGTTAGTNTLSAASSGLAGSPLSFTATGIPAAVSATHSTIAAAPGVIAASSGGTTSGVTVTARDQFDNLITGANVTVTATGTSNSFAPGASGTTNGSGVFTTAFSSTKAETKTIAATINGVALSTSSLVFVQPATASQLAFTQQPTTAAAGATITPAVVVTALDPFANVATGFGGQVTLAFGTNAGGGTLSGTNPVTAASGVATFGNLSIDKAGTGYTLTANATGPAGTTSGTFDVTAGAAHNLVLVSGTPQTDTVDATLANPLVVRVTDSLGNAVSGTTVTWAVTGGGGSVTGTATATTSISNASGLAQATRVLGTVAGPHSATATAGSLTGSPVTFTGTIDPGNASQLVFTQPPTDVTAGVAISPAIVVTARDRHTNTATGFTGNVALAFGNNAGGGTLSGGGATAAAAGVATFAGVSVDKAGTGYTLVASATGPTGATSAGFDVVAAAAALLSYVSGDAATDTVDATLPDYVVLVTDAFGNPISGETVTWTITSGGGTIGGSSTSATSNTGSNGQASAVRVLGTVPGSATVTAAVSGLSGSPFTFTATVLPGQTASLAVTQQPPVTVAPNTNFTVGITALDRYGNVATGFNGNVGMAIATGTGGSLSGTIPRTASNGVATFDDLTIDLLGVYTLQASVGSMTVITNPLTIL